MLKYRDSEGVKLVDLASNTIVSEVRVPASFSALIRGSEDVCLVIGRKVVKYNLHTGEFSGELMEFPTNDCYAEFVSPDGRVFCYRELSTGCIHIVNMSTGVIEYSTEEPIEITGMSPDGRYLAIGSGTRFNLLDANTYECIVTFDAVDVRSMDFSQDGSRMVYATNDDNVYVVNLDSPEEQELVYRGIVLQCMFTPDTSQIVFDELSGYNNAHSRVIVKNTITEDVFQIMQSDEAFDRAHLSMSAKDSVIVVNDLVLSFPSLTERQRLPHSGSICEIEFIESVILM
jgi:Tol biopolymer transport system component